MRLVQRCTDICRDRGYKSAMRSTARYISNRYPKIRYLNYKIKYGSSTPQSYNILHIDPNNINYCVQNPFIKTRSSNGTYILPGQWDKNVLEEDIMFVRYKEIGWGEQGILPIEEYGLYQCVKKHIERGIPLTETDFYQWLINNESELGLERYREQTFEKLGSLIKNISEDGYKSQKELLSESNPPLSTSLIRKKRPEHNEVMIAIGRDGRMFLDDGRHRFCIARILEKSEIPVRILVRHKKWQELREEVVKASSIESLSEKAKHHLNHPDMRTVLPQSISDQKHDRIINSPTN